MGTQSSSLQSRIEQRAVVEKAAEDKKVCELSKKRNKEYGEEASRKFNADLKVVIATVRAYLVAHTEAEMAADLINRTAIARLPLTSMYRELMAEQVYKVCSVRVRIVETMKTRAPVGAAQAVAPIGIAQAVAPIGIAQAVGTLHQPLFEFVNEIYLRHEPTLSERLFGTY